MLTPIHNPVKGKLRVIGYASGSGNTLFEAYALEKRMEGTPGGCPFEVVGVFTDNPNASCVETAKQLGIPLVSLDIRAYYKEREKPLKDREVRAAFDKEAMALLEPFHADAIMLAGYVWATTDALLDRYLMMNIHPADLSIQRADGTRAYAGANGVGDALNARESNLCSTAHLATKELDGGPILVISERVMVDYSLHEDDETRMRHYLKLVNAQNRLAGAKALLEIALGNFTKDAAGHLYYKGKPAPTGIRINSWEEDKPMFERHMEAFLNARSVAVIGASNKPGLGKAVIHNLLRDGFKGNVYAVNMRGEAVLDAKGYTSISEIEGEVDMAIITVPSAAVLQVAEQCGQKGVKALVCITAGFKETGEEGAKNEDELSNIVNRYNMRMIGPNCMGLLCASNNLNATMLSNKVAPGNIALVTQSGAIGAAMLDSAEQLGLGFSVILSLGNQMDVNACDILQLLADDPATKVILLYLESIMEPARFLSIASKIDKPILVLKSGRSAMGASAASSHTGSLAGNDSVVNALIEKAGIHRMDTLEDCLIAASALSKMPYIEGKRIGVLTNAGGPGILISDALAAAGFEMPLMTRFEREKLATQLFKESSTSNPIDVMAAALPEHYITSARMMLDSGAYDGLLMCCVPPASIDTAEVGRAFASAVEGAKIPVVSCFFGPTIGFGGRKAMHEAKVPAFEYPEHAVDAIISLQKPQKFTSWSKGTVPVEQSMKAREIIAKASKDAYLPMEMASRLLACYGIHMPGSALLTSADEVSGLSIGYPVAAKIDHPDIVHKSDVGGVRLNITDAKELTEVVNHFLTKFAGAKGVFVQEMIPKGLELIVGSASDPDLGSAVMVGLGGTHVEVFRDVVFGYPPISEELAKSMIGRLKCLPLLKGYRGEKGINMQALEEMLMKLSDLLLDHPSISELDLNPVVYDPQKNALIAVDVRIKIG